MHRVLAVALLLVGLMSCSRSTSRTLVVVSLSTTEQSILGEIIAQHVEKRLKISIDRMPGTNDARMAHETMASGQADIMPEYLSDALTRILRLPPTRSQSEVRERVRLEYQRSYQCECMEPLGVHHEFVMVVDATRPEYAAVRKLSDAIPVRPGWNLGASDEFLMRQDGMGAMMEAYDLRLRSAPKALEFSQRYLALKNKQQDMISADLTDSHLLDPGVRKLEDDRNVFIPYETAVVVRNDALSRYPGLRAALAELSGKFTDDQMRELNAQVDMRHRTIHDVARDFLVSAGLK